MIYLKEKKAFTLVEIMIVVAIIGLLATMAILNFINARENTQRNICIDNLRIIDSAKEQWALAEGVKIGDAINESEVNTYIKRAVSCPAGGTYVYGNIDTKPICDNSDPEHVLP